VESEKKCYELTFTDFKKQAYVVGVGGVVMIEGKG